MIMELIAVSALTQKIGLWKVVIVVSAGLIGLFANPPPAEGDNGIPGREDPDPNRGGGGSSSG